MTGILNVLLAGASGVLSTSLTAGSNVSGGNGEIGYSTSASIGSLSASAIGSKTVTEVVDVIVSSAVTTAILIVTGFSSNPGALWLGNVTFNGATFEGVNASFGYSSGTATWAWATSSGWGFANGSVYPGEIYHQW